MRLFVGIDITNHIRSRLAAYVERLRHEVAAEGVKWTRPESWHVTLKFLGETRKIDEIKRELSLVRMPAFELSVRQTGFFTPRSPRVFWAGIHSSAALPALALEIDTALSPLGFEREEQEYAPHITVARFGSGRPRGSAKDRRQPKMYSLKHLLDARPELAEMEFGMMTVTEFCLFESRPSPQGSEYVKLEKYALRATSGW
jgi:RNA 2',3'-cyclic 3'-phosphodiesterase